MARPLARPRLLAVALTSALTACDIPSQVVGSRPLPPPPEPGPSGTAPAVRLVLPSVGPSSGGAAVTLTGSSFRAGVNVFFGPVPATVLAVTDGAIDAVAPASAPGTVDVRVVNADGTSASVPSAFSYVGSCRPSPYSRPSGCPPRKEVFVARAAAGSTVKLAASFTDWSRQPLTMRDDGVPPDRAPGDGEFAVDVALAEGSYEYKFIVNGTWISDPQAPTEPIFGNSVRVADDACTPNLGDASPAFADQASTGDVVIGAPYSDGSSRQGPDPKELFACVDGRAVGLSYRADTGRVEARVRLPSGEHRFILYARDRAGYAARPTSGFFIVAGDVAPVAKAGGTRFARAGEPVVLDGSGSHDPDWAGIAAWQWQTVQAPSGAAVTLVASHDSAWVGYDSDPAAEPPKSGARQAFTPPLPGRYLFQLTVADAGGKTASARSEVVALPPLTGTPPKTRLAISTTSGRVSIEAKAAGAASYQWYEDIDNPWFFAPAATARLDFPTGLRDGVYLLHALATGNGQVAAPATAQVIVRDGKVVRADDFNLAPGWLASAVIYEVFVRKFADSDGDGTGDLAGLTGKLDYLRDLGVDTLWLMPIQTSNDRDHGYHTVDYDHVEPDYGTDGDLAGVVSGAHKRNMRVVLDLALNHTSRKHPAFVRAFASPSAPTRSWYIWFSNGKPAPVDTYGYGRELGGTRLLVADGWGDIPDINYANPQAHQYFFDVARRLLDPNGDGDPSDGVDGFRLDHVTGPEHFVWAELRREIKAMNPDALMLAEVFRDFDNSGRGYGIKDYYGGEFDLAFTFPFYWDLESVFTASGDVRRIDATLADMASKFPLGAAHCFFSMNHDVPWRSTNVVYYGGGDAGRGAPKVMAAHSLQALLPNSPQFFYGEELGVDTYRGRMPFDRDDGRHPIKEQLKWLLKLRRTHPALTDPAAFSRVAVPTPYTAGVYAFVRAKGADRVFAVVNATANPASPTLDLAGAVPDGAWRARDLATGAYQPMTGLTITVSLGAYETRAYAIEP